MKCPVCGRTDQGLYYFEGNIETLCLQCCSWAESYLTKLRIGAGYADTLYRGDECTYERQFA